MKDFFVFAKKKLDTQILNGLIYVSTSGIETINLDNLLQGS
jgi:hypothetical protein